LDCGGFVQAAHLECDGIGSTWYWHSYPTACPDAGAADATVTDAGQMDAGSSAD
jgi:hypothetical protein